MNLRPFVALLATAGLASTTALLATQASAAPAPVDRIGEHDHLHPGQGSIDPGHRLDDG